MSMLLDVDTSTLDTLDFEPRCDCVDLDTGQKCGDEATHWLVCSVCGDAVGLACAEHDRQLLSAEWTVTHKGCGSSAPMCVLIKAVAL